jgi:integrase
VHLLRSPANTNNALRTLSRMLSDAAELGLIPRKPKIHMVKERRRHSMLSAEWEALLLPVAKPLLQDVIVLMRDTGLRNRRELFRVRIELIRWDEHLIGIPDSKTPSGAREAPASPRAMRIMRRLAGNRTSGWLFPSKRSASGHLTTVQKLWREALDALEAQGIHVPDDLVLYCARHDFGTSAYKATKNIFAVMEAMGHKDIKSAQQYQHQDISEVTEFLRKRA